jgi:ABC-type uncharacterized transport system substrate-binding protein
MDKTLQRIKLCVRTLTAAFLLAFAAGTWAGPRTIFIVESYHEGMAWDHDYKQALKLRLADRYRFTGTALDTKRLPEFRHREMANRALAQIREQRPALVVLGDDAALRLVGPDLDKMGIPGVYLGINNNPRAYGPFRNITGVLERPLMKRNTVLVREMLPDIQKILVLFDRNEASRVIFQESFSGQSSYSIGGVRVELKMVDSFERWQLAVSGAARDGYGAIVAGLYQSLLGRDGQVADENQVIAWTSANTPVPLFGFWDFQVGADKAIGGLVLNATHQGEAAARLIEQILEHGTAPAAIFPYTAPQGEYLFSRSQLKRFKLQLPADVAPRAHFVG